MRPFKTEIVLQTTWGRVWELLADFSLYPQWHPLFPKVTGSGAAGDRHQLLVHLPGIDPFPVQVTLAAKAEGALSWQSTFLGRPFLAWTFSCRLEQVSPGSLKVLQHSEFHGVLAPLFRFAFSRSMEEGMAQLNLALRRWGEKGNVRCLRC
ncbi:SRPBCC domain-containing protein [Geomonas sp. Red69]|uniref:SRPBCC domain-containing protein n=1 Tax=Geomonas diazotrophica TaxID=2843197 RepID=UPI001C11FDC2|nr:MULTISPECIES: SRPBCC domain-containing protein [Geomonas]MBU5637629.1 SRPBCC domain-containing protein [Geomonas diazotrophica]QXE88421.1 SRPBCC domain-containing protein [Geomonas nitrogeniifigens]